ncbi:TylF/MycF/NovP-related O-methyltransferase [Hahella ganghwensis]|uniref:TylF/MycF/NovP-related O-methyltransferase n=1 Tax=Hahella ganghwensis TaxID=286420 RepID=UPI0003664545|nr:TylF/MycF/NovP-related O-methyltransferase [Hahella ganghwensis]
MDKIFGFLKFLWLAVFGSKVTRADARYEILSSLTSRWGYRLYNRKLWWHKDHAFMDMWNGFPEASNKIHERRYVLYNLTKSLTNLEGDTAECGAFRGGGSYIILSALSDSTAQHHIFDSFEGLSDPAEVDAPTEDDTYEWKAGDLWTDESVVIKNLSLFKDRIKIYKGWIPERFSEVSDKKFRLIHIDVDLYQPTLDTLSFFYERMVPGGMIVCDDYGFETCPGATKALDDFFRDKTESVIHLTTGTAFVIKR